MKKPRKAGVVKNAKRSASAPAYKTAYNSIREVHRICDDKGNMTHQQCRICDVLRLVQNFYKDIRNARGYQTTCTLCLATAGALRVATPGGFIKKLVSACKGYDKKYTARQARYGTDLTVAWVTENMIKGCFWSGLPLQTKSYCWDKLSVDRIDDSIRHCQENCRLVILALNNQYKWTDSLFQVALTAYMYPPKPLTEQEAKQRSAFISRRNTDNTPRRKPDDGAGNKFCTGCNLFHGPEKFTDKQSDGCATCRSARSKLQREGSIYGALMSSYNRSVGRGKKVPRVAGDLTFVQLKQIYVNQRGLCPISGMELETFGFWKVSNERTDPRSTYTASNVEIICACLNITDKTADNPNKTAAGQGLTKERWSMIMQSMIEKMWAEWCLDT